MKTNTFKSNRIAHTVAWSDISQKYQVNRIGESPQMSGESLKIHRVVYGGSRLIISLHPNDHLRLELGGSYGGNES